MILAVGLFAAMKLGGEDRGQMRFGLIPHTEPEQVQTAQVAPQPDEVVAPAVVPEPANVITAAFVPDAPLMGQPVMTEAAALAPEPPVTGRIMRVNVRAVNVRAGPGTEYSVMDSLRRGDEVLVVAEADGPDGWAMIRIEGDGLEGYISAALLSE